MRFSNRLNFDGTRELREFEHRSVNTTGAEIRPRAKEQFWCTIFDGCCRPRAKSEELRDKFGRSATRWKDALRVTRLIVIMPAYKSRHFPGMLAQPSPIMKFFIVLVVSMLAALSLAKPRKVANIEAFFHY